MPSNTQAADRRVQGYTEDLEKLRGPAGIAAAALNDNALLRSTLARLSEILHESTGEPVRIAVQLGRAKEAISSYDDAVETVERAAIKRAEIEKLRPLTTEAAHAAIEGK